MEEADESFERRRIAAQRQPLQHAQAVHQVAKAGIERWLFNLSRDQPLVYGKAGYENPFFIAYAPGVVLEPAG